MAAPGPFRALSLDLWFTTVYHDGDFDDRWEAARREVLGRLLRRDGRALSPEEIDGALAGARERISAAGGDLVATDPAELLGAVAGRLEESVVGDPAAAVEAFSSAGLHELPPEMNPEAARVVEELGRRGVPSVLVTNSGRRASSWAAFLRGAGRPTFRAIVSSADLGVRKPDPKIFREAARCLGVPVERILHVGDRWELDVEGAIAAGCGAVLYRGLWHRYPEGLYPSVPDPLPGTSAVRVIDRLDELLEPSLWEPAAVGGRAVTG